jgi:hypothetical protein
MTRAKDLFDLAEALEKGASAPSVDPPDAVPAAALPGVVCEPLSRAEKLQTLTDTALNKAEEIMKLPLDRRDPSYGTTIRAQTALVNTALNTQLKADENSLKVRATCNLDMLMELMAREDGRRRLETVRDRD